MEKDERPLLMAIIKSILLVLAIVFIAYGIKIGSVAFALAGGLCVGAYNDCFREI